MTVLTDDVEAVKDQLGTGGPRGLLSDLVAESKGFDDGENGEDGEEGRSFFE